MVCGTPRQPRHLAWASAGGCRWQCRLQVPPAPLPAFPACPPACVQTQPAEATMAGEERWVLRRSCPGFAARRPELCCAPAAPKLKLLASFLLALRAADSDAPPAVSMGLAEEMAMEVGCRMGSGRTAGSGQRRWLGTASQQRRGKGRWLELEQCARAGPGPHAALPCAHPSAELRRD